MREIDNHELMRLYNENRESNARCASVLRDRKNGVDYYQGRPARHALYMELIADDMTDGFLMGLPHGSVIKQGTRANYYRGENQVFPSSVPTLNRRLGAIDNKEDRVVETIVADMRVYEFRTLLYMFDHVSLWEAYGATVLFEPLAQHYGISTRWLDITNDFEVALFFACCTYDRNAGQWRPLVRKDTEESNSTRYGVIFRQPYWAADRMDVCMGVVDSEQKSGDPTDSEPSSYDNVILPIGFQPFMRCHMQRGYGIHNALDLYANPQFEALKFRHSEELSRFIYRQMDSGNKIFPHEGLSLVQDQIDLINDSKQFAEESFVYAIEKNNEVDPLDMRECLLKRGYAIGASPIRLSRQRKRYIDRIYESFSFEKNYGISVSTRLTRRG